GEGSIASAKPRHFGRDLGTEARVMSRSVITLLALLGSSASLRAAEPIQFRRDVIAALCRAGCNSGACHGSPQGKNGFRLSLRGQDPDLDLFTLTKDVGGRRRDRVSPDDSLILLKGSGPVSHQGGTVFGRNDPAYRVIARWIEEGCRDVTPAPLARLEVLPGSGRLPPGTAEQQLAVRAHFADGTTRDVTDLAVFTSADPDAPVSRT